MRTEAEVCGRCGADRPPSAAWCPRCLERYDGRNRAGGYAGAPRPAVIRSRTRAGATTMGLRGRVAVTAVLGLPLLWFWYDAVTKSHLVALVLWVVPGTAIVAIVLRDVWRREKVVVR